MRKQSFLRGSAVLFVMVFVTKLMGLVYKVPLTSMLGGSGMSCYSGAFAVFTPVFAAAASGAPSALSRLAAEQLALGRYKNAERIRRTAMLGFLLLSLICSTALILLSDILAVRVIHIPEARYAVSAIALSLPPAAIMNVRRGWSEGLGSMTPTASSEICETFFKAILGLWLPSLVLRYAAESFELYHGCFGRYCADMREAQFTALPYAAAAAALGVSLASFIACGFLFLNTARPTRECRREFQNSGLPLNISRRQSIASLVKFALPATFTAIAATLSGMADILTVPPCLEYAMSRDGGLFAFLAAYGVESGNRAGFVYGSYTGLALTIFGLLPTFTAMLGKSALPTLSGALAKNNLSAAAGCIRSMLLISSVISFAGGLGIALLARPLLCFFFAGSAAEIAVCVKPLAILGAAVIFMGISLPCLGALQACSKQTAALAITLLGTLLKLLLNMLLISIPQLNICGAAAATAISQGVSCILAVTALIRYSGVGRICVTAIFKPLLPAILCAAAAMLVQNNLISHFDGIFGRLGVAISVAIGAIICLISLGLLCISPKNQISYLFSKKISKNT